MAHSETPFSTFASTCRILGGAATGKTEELVQRIVGLLASGVKPEEIGVFAATPEAARALQIRLENAADGMAVPQVETVFNCQMRLLSLPEARRANGCEPHIMLRFEENIFMEDMKTCGVQPKRLAEMLRFLYRSCCDLENMTKRWFYDDDEEKAFNLLVNLQRYYGAYLRQTMPWFAYTFASDFPAVLTAAGMTYAHVFVDDYQALTKASQCLLGLFARQSLTVAADPLARVSCLEEFPFPAGVEALAEQNAECTTVELTCAYAARVVNTTMNTLRADESLAGAAVASGSDVEGKMQLMPFASPTAELNGVAAHVAALLADGVAPEDIAIAAPKPTWMRNVAKALAGAGVPVASPERSNVSGDVRTLDTSFDGRVVTLLKLAANNDDRLAIRCWCGFGDYLANSALFTGMARVNVHVKFDTCNISTTGTADALFEQQRERILDALENARTYVKQLNGLTGLELAREAARLIDPERQLSPMLSRAFGSASADADAAELIAVLERTVNEPRFGAEGVRVGLTCDFLGLSPRVMILSGMVNGLTPERNYFDPTMVERDKRPGILATEAAKTYAAAGKAQEQLVFSYFTAAPLMESEAMRLKAVRVRLLNGVRTCQIDPSETIRSLTGVYFND